jgi:hypothetical protein
MPGLRKFYQMLAEQHGDKSCIVDELYEDGTISCRDAAARASYELPDYSRFPTDSDALIREVLAAMKKRDFGTIEKYFGSSRNCVGKNGA